MVQPKGYTWAMSPYHGFYGVYLINFEWLQDIQKVRDTTSQCWQLVISRDIVKIREPGL